MELGSVEIYHRKGGMRQINYDHIEWWDRLEGLMVYPCTYFLILFPHSFKCLSPYLVTVTLFVTFPLVVKSLFIPQISRDYRSYIL